MVIVTLWSCKPHRLITIVHTNDTHSQIDPNMKNKVEPDGGVEARATLIEMLRQEDKNLIYLDGGDMVQGQPYFNLWKGTLEMLCMNQQQLIASTFGNHEFDNGLEYLNKMLEVAKFPIVNCNYDCSETIIKDKVVKHLIIERNGVKIGITGVTCDPNKLIFDRNWEGIKYEPASPAANREAKWLKEQGCDLVILLSHEGYYAESNQVMDRMIAAQSHDIDLIIGGHSHTNIENGMIEMNADGKPVVITQTGGKTNSIGKIKVYVKGHKVDSIVCSKIKESDFDHTDLYKAIWDTISIRKVVAPYRAELAATMDQIIGHTDINLIRGNGKAPLCVFTGKAYMAIGEKLTGEKMDCSIMNQGGIRSDIPAGDITVGSIYKSFPFENTITIVDIKGRYLKEMFDNGFGREPATANIEMTDKGLYIGGEPVEMDKVYKVCTIDYVSEGNDGFGAMVKADSINNTMVLIRDAMIDYVKSINP